MTPAELTLWTQIQAFQIDKSPAAFSFTDRVGRENGWSKRYALRVIEEYKKFIFLCCVSGTGVTPSDAVDQVWHLHLTFTQSYWVDFCRHTLGRDIHHNPTKGGASEAQKFDGFYDRSRQLYTDTFGHNPPDDIWPPNNVRFSDIDFQRVNLNRYWLVPKPGNRPKKQFMLLVVVVTAAVFIQSTGAFIGLALLGLFGFIYLLTRLSKLQINAPDRKPTDGSDGGNSGCSTTDSGHHGDADSGHDNSSDSGHSGCSGCSGSGCSGCGGGD
jgi:hypothetical protein